MWIRIHKPTGETGEWSKEIKSLKIFNKWSHNCLYNIYWKYDGILIS